MQSSIRISSGALVGTREDDLVIFRGIPFARPPIGALRFRAPEPPEPWSGERDATAFGPGCPQPPDLVSNMLGFEAHPTSEDCLTLNVWAPAGAAAPRPVLVWIHGGAFVVGSGARRLTDAAALARRGDVVVVSCNYRLGAFGFLYLDEHGGADISAVPNPGLLDQIAALEWVQREIAAFGGDPNNVTVFGESAGSVSIASLLAMPTARSRFRRAILQSGSANLIAPRERATRVAAAVLQQLAIEPRNLAALRSVSADRLLEAEIRVLMAPPDGSGGLPFQPVIDGDVLRNPLEEIGAGCAREVGMLIGTTLDEMKLFDLMDPKVRELDEAALLRRCARNLGEEHAARAIALYQKYRGDRGASVAAPDLWSAIESDRLMRAPSMRLAELQAGVQPDVYAYLFTWPSPFAGGSLGSCHALDLPFVFGTLRDPRIEPFAGSGADADRLAEQMQDAWIAFARTGTPHHAGLPGWPRYEPQRRATMLLGRECGVVETPYDAERAFWTTV